MLGCATGPLQGRIVGWMGVLPFPPTHNFSAAKLHFSPAISTAGLHDRYLTDGAGIESYPEGNFDGHGSDEAPLLQPPVLP